MVWHRFVHHRRVPITLDVCFTALARLAPCDLRLLFVPALHAPLAEAMEALLEGLCTSGIDKVDEGAASAHFTLKFNWHIQEVVLPLVTMLVQQAHEHVPRESLWHLLHDDCGEAIVAAFRTGIADAVLAEAEG